MQITKHRFMPMLKKLIYPDDTKEAYDDNALSSGLVHEVESAANLTERAMKLAAVR